MKVKTLSHSKLKMTQEVNNAMSELVDNSANYLTKAKPRSRSPSSNKEIEERILRRKLTHNQDRDSYIPNYVRRNESFSSRGHSGATSSYRSYRSDFRADYNNLPDPSNVDYLVTYKQFADYTRQSSRRQSGDVDKMDDEELYRRYGIYRENYTRRQMALFFDSHKDEAWFRAKYHPKDSLEQKSEIAKDKAGHLKKFIGDLETGVFEDICYDQKPGSSSVTKHEKMPDISSTDNVEAEEKNAELADVDTDDVLKDNTSKSENKCSNQTSLIEDTSPSFSLFIKNVPLNAKRSDFLQVCSPLEGFERVALGDPHPGKNFQRIGWITFSSTAAMENAFKSLEGVTIESDTKFPLQLSRNQTTFLSPRFISSVCNEKERLIKDLSLINELGGFLDKESQLEDGITTVSAHIKDKFELDVDLVTSATKELENSDTDIVKLKKALDLYITYLRKVHFYDYYSNTEAQSLEDFTRRTPIYLRKEIAGEISAKEAQETSRWLERHDLKTRLRMSSLESQELVKAGGRALDTEIDKDCEKMILKIDNAKYRCKLCVKLFRGPEFVSKHIRLKHPLVVEEATQNVLFYNAYVRDPSHPQPMTNVQNLNSNSQADMRRGASNIFSRLSGPSPFNQQAKNSYGSTQDFVAYRQDRSGGEAGGPMRARRGHRDYNSRTLQFNPPPPPLLNRSKDPRQIQTYEDLDATSQKTSKTLLSYE